MVGQDRAAVVYSIAITAIFLGVAASMGAVQDSSPYVSAPIMEPMMDEPEKTEVEMEEVMMEEEIMMEEKVMMEEEIMMEEKVMMEEEIMMEEKVMMEEPARPTTHNVEIPVGTSVPGCETSNECYLPADITINAGDTIVWDNVDSAVHTVTAGTPADAQTGVFHSDLIMPGATWDNTFDDVGSNTYFCMVHPWMTGSVTVN